MSGAAAVSERESAATRGAREHLRCHGGQESGEGTGSEVDDGAGDRAGDKVGQNAAGVCVKRDVPAQNVTIMQ